MSRLTFAAATLVAQSASAYSYNATDVAIQFDLFKSTYGKTYSSAEEEKIRLQVFAANMETAAELNDDDSETAVFGATKFSDLTPQEFKRFLNYIPLHSKTDDYEVSKPSLDAAPPTNFDWRDTKGVVSAVKNQGQCGSCWAFSTVEAIESQWVLAGNSPEVFSTQQIISCDKKFGDEGCDGGDTVTAYQYVESAGGLVTAESYPDKSHSTGRSGTCKRFAHPTMGQISGFTYATKPCKSGACNDQDEDTMVANVASSGPASICVNAEKWQLYNKGVMTGKHCGSHKEADLDHCVQVVGYNGYSSDEKSDYWIVRNSWETDWGEDGYIYVELGTNACGIANEVTFPTIAK
jgi:C1A family cysteine protease